jgi:LCP family protein required for cell wall assembly
MITDIEGALSSKIKVEEYSSDIEAAKALLDGKVDAAIYNKAYTSIIAESLENDEYEDQVRVLYQYGIQTSIEKESVDVGEPFNVLISGIDVYGDISQTSRSDVNIIVTVNPKTKKVLLTSTPRDYFVPIPDVSNGVRDKLTHAGIYGVDASMRTLEELYGIDITYFVRVNFDTLIKLVDAMDGLDVYVEYPFDCYTDEYHFDKGWHDMFGDQVLAFCRERYSFADGDNQRGRNQEQVLKALIEKLLSPAILPHYAEILDSLDGFFQLNMPQEKIAELVNMQLSDNASWQILKQTAEQGESALETTYSAGSTPLYIMWPDDASVKTNTARIEMIMSEGYTTNVGDPEITQASAQN